MPCKGSAVRGCKPFLGVKRVSPKQKVSPRRVALNTQAKCESYMRIPWSEEMSWKHESAQLVRGNRFTPGLTSPPSSSDAPDSGTFQNFRFQSGVLFVWGARAWWRWRTSTSHSDMVLDPILHCYNSIF